MIFKPLLKSALGEEPCDLLFKNARFANLCTMEYETGDIAVKDGVIVGIGAGYEAKETVDCTGRLLLPGFIEGGGHGGDHTIQFFHLLFHLSLSLL